LNSIPMQSNTHSGIAPASSSKLGPKQTRATDLHTLCVQISPFSGATSEMPPLRKLVTSKRSGFPTFLHSHPPASGALRNPTHAGRSRVRPASAPRTRVGASRPLRPLREQSAFTLIELMAATTVLSVVLLMMVGMQDQMSKAWSNANRRTESTREARAGLRMLTEDFAHYYVRSDYTKAGEARANYNPITNKIPIVYFSDASISAGKLTISNAQPKSQALFFLSQRRPGTNKESDQLTAVGYYIAWETNTSISGFSTTNYNLYRYVNTNTVSAITSFTNATDVRDLFPGGTTNKSYNEILARNAVNLRIYFYPTSSVSNALIYGIKEGSGSPYSGNRCVFEVTTYPDSIANSLLQGNLNNWTSTNNIKRYGRTFEITIDLERGLSE